jgi:hypothetical protein
MNTGADVTQDRIRKALAGVLLPLARTLLRCGVSYTEFSDLSKRAFVEAASADYGVRNRPTNIARVAVMTGLSRKEVSRIRRNRKKPLAKDKLSLTVPAAVLHAWHRNRRYSTRSGEPKVLPFAGSGASFSGLVRALAKDIPPGAMRRELVRAGAIRVIDRNHVVPVKRHFIPDTADERVLVGLELGLRRLAETIAFNSNIKNEGPKRFQRFVEGPPVKASQLRQAREMVQSLLAGFSVQLDDYLSALSTGNRQAAGAKPKGHRLGVGLYYYDESND